MKKIAGILMLTAIMLSLCESAYAVKVPTGSKSSSGFTAMTEPSIMPYYTNKPVEAVIMPYRKESVTAEFMKEASPASH